MKKLYTLMALAIAQFHYAQTVDFEGLSLAPNSAYDGSDLSGTPNSDTTAYDSTFVFSGLVMTNQWNIAFGAPGYLSQGWVFSNKPESTASGLAGAYHSYAGGGADGSDNYAITYVGSGQVIQLENNEVATFSTIDITNNNYAAYSMINGDNIAKKFGGSTGDDQDWFLLDIIGYDASGNSVGTIKFYMADYRFTDNSQDYIINDWTSVDISSLGEVNKIRFELSSSDNNSSGFMNTPSYIALDNISYGFTSVEKKESNQLSIYPNPSNNTINLSRTVNNGSINVYSLSGQQVLTRDIQAPLSTIDISILPSGIYTLVIDENDTFYTSKLIKQ